MKKLPGITTLCFILLISCGPDRPYQNWHVVGNPYEARTSLTDPTIVNCDPTGSGCQSLLNHLGWTYEDIIVMRNSLDTFYHYYYNNDMPGYFENNNAQLAFEAAETERPGAWGKVQSGQYGVKVLDDSSIVILKDVNGSKTDPANIEFAFDRDKQQ